MQGGWGNANQWPTNAARSGFPVGKIPHVNDVVAWPAGYAGAGSVGHVARVAAVNANGSIAVSEMNWTGGPGVADARNIPASIVSGLTFISPKGTTQGGGAGLFGISGLNLNPADALSGAVTGFGTMIQKGAIDLSISAGFFLLALILIFTGLLFMVFSTNAGRSAAKEGAVLATV